MGPLIASKNTKTTILDVKIVKTLQQTILHHFLAQIIIMTVVFMVIYGTIMDYHPTERNVIGRTHGVTLPWNVTTSLQNASQWEINATKKMIV